LLLFRGIKMDFFLNKVMDRLLCDVIIHLKKIHVVWLISHTLHFSRALLVCFLRALIATHA
jgi:hypothetical protein